MRTITLVVLILVWAYSPVAHSYRLYKWVDDNGQVHYADRPPPPNIPQVERKNVEIDLYVLPWTFRSIPLSPSLRPDHFTILGSQTRRTSSTPTKVFPAIGSTSTGTAPSLLAAPSSSATPQQESAPIEEVSISKSEPESTTPATQPESEPVETVISLDPEPVAASVEEFSTLESQVDLTAPSEIPDSEPVEAVITPDPEPVATATPSPAPAPPDDSTSAPAELEPTAAQTVTEQSAGTSGGDGTNWYVRPAGGDYGREGGSSYGSAWDGLLNVTWGSDGVGPGDTLWVCGLHVHNVTNKSYIDRQADINVVSGTEHARITIRGDCPGDPGIVWGAHGFGYDDWTNEGGGVWSIPLPAYSFPDWYFQDIGIPSADSFIVLDKESSIDGVRNNPGSHYAPEYKTGSLLYVKLTDGGNPIDRVYGNRWGYHFRINGREYITFMHLTLHNFIGPNRNSPQPTNITWMHCKFAYGEHGIFDFYDGATGIKIIDSELSWAGNGIYNISNTNNAPSDYEYSGNYIHDMGVRKINQNSDAHGIGIQGGINGSMIGNTFKNVGSGITLYAFGDGTTTGLQVMKNILVKNNVMDTGHTLGGANNRGFEEAQDNNSMSDKSGIVFEGNSVKNVRICYRTKSEDVVKFINNTCDSAAIGLASNQNYLPEGATLPVGASIEHRGNVYTNISQLFINYRTGAKDFFVVSDDNVYNGVTSAIFNWRGTSMTFKEWQSIEWPNSTFDQNSLATP